MTYVSQSSFFSYPLRCPVIGYDPTELFVFNIAGSFLYSVTFVDECIDSTFGPDNSFWIAEQIDKGDLQKSKLLSATFRDN